MDVELKPDEIFKIVPGFKNYEVSPNTVKRIWKQERYKNITENIK